MEKSRKLDVKLGSNGLMTVPGLVSQPVADTAGVLDAFEQVLAQGEGRRAARVAEPG